MKISDPGTVIVENITPQLDGGRYPIKRAVGQDLVVEADIFKEGHDVVSALLKWRRVGESTWLETPMEPLVNDRWRGVLHRHGAGPWEYTIEAWGDTFKSWQEEIHKKFDGRHSRSSQRVARGRSLRSGGRYTRGGNTGRRIAQRFRRHS